jgi:Ca2+-binding RTX toxin-like protein
VARRATFALLVLLVTVGLTGTGARAKGAKKHGRSVKHGVRAKVSRNTLTIRGNRRANTVVLRLRRGKRRMLLVDVRDDGSADFTFNRKAFKRISILGGAGDDSMEIDDANGVFTDSELTTIEGGPGKDEIRGGAGAETIRGGPDADTVDGGGGVDAVSLGDGDDVFRSGPGGGSDVVEGEAGGDRLVIDGSEAAESFGLSANGARLRATRDAEGAAIDANGIEAVDINPLGAADAIAIAPLAGTAVGKVNVDLALTLGGTSTDGLPDSLVVNGTGGDDTLTVAGGASGVNVAGIVPSVSILHPEASDGLTVGGQGGADTIDASALAAGTVALTLDGGPQVDTLMGSPGRDLVDGGTEDDVATLGEGDDTFRSSPGGGSDLVEGGGGVDRLLMDGSEAADSFFLSANGERLRAVRDPGSAIDANDIETAELHPLGGADTIFPASVVGTDVTRTIVDLEGAPGGGLDGQADSVLFNASDGNDVVTLSGGASGVNVSGVGTPLSVTHADPASDLLTVNAMNGTDTVDASGLAAGGIGLVIEGGPLADILIGSGGGDLVDGGGGEDVALLGAGDDTLRWGPGGGSDTVEGQSGADRLRYNGSNVNENVDVSANGGRVRFFRDIANVTLDLNDIEGLDLNVIGGADNVTVNDLAGTDVTEANVDLASSLGGSAGDGQFDSVTVNASNGGDVASIGGGPSGVSMSGLAPTVSVSHGEAVNDRLTVNLLAGDDHIDASGVAAGAVGLTLNGGDNNDSLTGGAGDDAITGGNGDDVLIGGPGLDLLDGGPGNNTIVQ